MTPTTTVIVIAVIVGIFAYLLSKLIDTLLRISKRIESSNTHLDEIKTEIVGLSEILSSSLVELHKKQESNAGRIEDLENENEFRYDIDDLDELFNQAAKFVMEDGKASASLIQRRLSIGYARAARILDQLEHEGYVGPASGSAPRIVLKTPLEGSDQ